MKKLIILFLILSCAGCAQTPMDDTVSNQVELPTQNSVEEKGFVTSAHTGQWYITAYSDITSVDDFTGATLTKTGANTAIYKDCDDTYTFNFISPTMAKSVETSYISMGDGKSREVRTTLEFYVGDNGEIQQAYMYGTTVDTDEQFAEGSTMVRSPQDYLNNW